MEKTLAQGAEAIIVKKNNSVLKRRLKKEYRISEIDDELRTKRTKSEAKILSKMKGLAPEVLSVGEDTIEMEFIDGDVVKNILDTNIMLARKIGEETGRMHDFNIIHGDLTTSNMMLDSAGKLRFIDFGLSFVSSKVEDKAVDLHLFREAVESRHFRSEKKIWEQFMAGYSPKDREAVFERLHLVELRGRNKQKY